MLSQYYGSWTDTQKTIIEDFISNIGSTSWFDIERTYYYQKDANSPKEYTTGPVVLGKTVSDSSYSSGKALKENDLPDLIKKYIASNQLPLDPTGVYFVLTASDVAETMPRKLGGGASFCKDYCGYHISTTYQGTRIFYAMVGNPSSCVSTCAITNLLASPNGDIGLDTLLSPVAHELVEAMSDPISDINSERAWEDDDREENADKW